MNRRAPARTAASRRFTVPTTLVNASIRGSRTETATLDWAARWTTTSGRHHSTTAAPAGEQTSETNTSSRLRPERNAASRAGGVPTDRSSMTATLIPSASSRGTRCEPMNPAPPVTRTLMPPPPCPGRPTPSGREDRSVEGLSRVPVLVLPVLAQSTGAEEPPLFLRFDGTRDFGGLASMDSRLTSFPIHTRRRSTRTRGREGHGLSPEPW